MSVIVHPNAPLCSFKTSNNLRFCSSFRDDKYFLLPKMHIPKCWVMVWARVSVVILMMGWVSSLTVLVVQHLTFVNSNTVWPRGWIVTRFYPGWTVTRFGWKQSCVMHVPYARFLVHWYVATSPSTVHKNFSPTGSWHLISQCHIISQCHVINLSMWTVHVNSM